MRHRLVVGSFAPSVHLDVARTGGYLEAHDLEVQEVPVTSSPAQFQALIDGDLDVGLTGPTTSWPTASARPTLSPGSPTPGS